MKLSNSNTLFHYTKDIKTLCNILEKGFFPNYCKETFPDEDFCAIPMVSFCDVPLTRADSFIGENSYGEVAIGMSKDWGIRSGLAPMLYLPESPNRTISIQKIILLLTKELNKASQIQGGFTGTQRDLVNYLAPIIKKNMQFHFLRGLIKPYIITNNKGEKIIAYNDNEWRYLVINDSNAEWFYKKDDYNKWRGNGTKPSIDVSPLTFFAKDVKYLVVENEENVERMISHIEGLRKIGGNSSQMIDKKQELNDKKHLIRSIITLKQINEDF